MENHNQQSQKFNFKKFIEDSKATLYSPKDYFSKMPVSGGFGEPIIKVLIYGVIFSLFEFLWMQLGIKNLPDEILLEGGTGVMVMVLAGRVVTSLIGLFIGSAIVLVFSMVLSGNKDFEACVRVVASLMIISVVSSAFSFLSGVNYYLSLIISIAISLWGLYLLYNALAYALKATEKGSRILTIILAVLLFLVIVLTALFFIDTLLN
jgi:hypothetical protein